MSYVVIGSAALTIGGKLFGGFSAGSKKNKANIQAGKDAAYDIWQDQLGLLGDVRTQAVSGATQQAELGFAGAESQYAGGVRDVTMGTRTGTRDIRESSEAAISQSGLATSGTIEQKVKTQTADLMGKYKSDMTKLFESRDLASKQRDLTISTAKEEADLAYRSGEMSAEEAYQDTLTQLEGEPDNFLEGMYG